MKKNFFLNFLFISLLTLGMLSPQHSQAQEASNDIFAADDDDLNVGGDIFTDFSEDL